MECLQGIAITYPPQSYQHSQDPPFRDSVVGSFKRKCGMLLPGSLVESLKMSLKGFLEWKRLLLSQRWPLWCQCGVFPWFCFSFLVPSHLQQVGARKEDSTVDLGENLSVVVLSKVTALGPG